MAVDRETIKKKALEAIDKASDKELDRGIKDQDYAHDWLQAVIGFIANLMTAITSIFRGCHISTALVKHLGLPDNCEELQVLRRFRDEYIVNSNVELRLKDLHRYYCYAPHLIQWIEARDDSASIWQKIQETVDIALEAIAEGRYDYAYNIYKAEILGLRISVALQD